MKMMRHRIVALAAALAFAPFPASASETAAETWFEGEDAVYAAGRHINAALGYEAEYNAGRLAVQWVPEYADAFFIRLRLAPQEGHQVVYEKGKTKPEEADKKLRCAEFMLRVERFEAETLQAYMDNKQRGPLLVDSGDEADGRICVRADGAVGVTLREVLKERDLAGRSAHAFLEDGRGYLGGI